MVDEAEQMFRRTLELNPTDAISHSNLVFLVAANQRWSHEQTQEEQKNWDKLQGQDGRSSPFPTRPLIPANGRRLKIGHVSPNLRAHAVSSFFEPLLSAHDRKHFEIFLLRVTSGTPLRLHYRAPEELV